MKGSRRVRAYAAAVDELHATHLQAVTIALYAYMWRALAAGLLLLAALLVAATVGHSPVLVEVGLMGLIPAGLLFLLAFPPMFAATFLGRRGDQQRLFGFSFTYIFHGFRYAFRTPPVS